MLTQAEAAAILGVTTQTIRMWEIGAVIPNHPHMEAMADRLHNPNLSGEWLEWYTQR